MFLAIGIILIILYLFFESWGLYEFELFAYSLGITVKKLRLKTNAKTFEMVINNLHRTDNTNYKFVSDNICLVRSGSEKMPFYSYLRPIPLSFYKITIKKNKYVICQKISFLYLLIFGFILYEIAEIIFNKRNIDFSAFFGMVSYSIICLIIIIYTRIRLKKVAINFLKYMKDK